MSYLLDTDVLSETQKRRPNAHVLDWFRSARPDELHVSVLSIGEIRQGATKLRQRGDVSQALHYERWLAVALEVFAGRIQPVTVEVADTWGRQGTRRAPASVDGLIAATAIVHGLTMVTRNVKHFGLTGVRMVNPFDA